MLLKLFKSNNPLVVFLLPVLALLLWLPSLVINPDIHSQGLYYTLPAYNKLVGLFSSNLGLKVAALLLIVLQSFYIIRLNFRHIFIETKTYLPAVLFILLASVMHNYHHLHPALVANTFVLFALDIVFNQSHSKNLIRRYFESGLFIGLASMFYLPALVFIIIVWISFSSLNSLRWRYVAGSIMGLLVPWLFWVALHFIVHQNISPFKLFSQFWMFNAVPPNYGMFTLVGLGIIVALALIAFVNGLGMVSNRKISTRKYFMLFFWLIVLCLSPILFFPQIGPDMLIFLVCGIAVHLAMFFKENRNKIFGELLFSLLILAILSTIWL
jgi:hypothetical protein